MDAFPSMRRSGSGVGAAGGGVGRGVGGGGGGGDDPGRHPHQAANTEFASTFLPTNRSIRVCLA